MGDLECGFEEMQGVRLGYLLIKGKQMFALSQVFTDLLKNIPRTTVHKRMDHLKVKKHHCDLKELRKLKAINTIAFHAAKCTLISREDVEALYLSCKTERVLKSNKRRARPARDEDSSPGFLCTDATLWKEKVWFSLHGVPETLTLHHKPGRSRDLAALRPDFKLPHFYRKTHGRDYRSAAKSAHKHFKNYETSTISGNRVTWSQRHAFFRSRQSVVLQSARLSRSAGDLLHKRRRRCEGGGREPHHHPPPVLLLQPKYTDSHGTSFGPIHLGPDFYLNPRPHHHHHHQQQQQQPSFPESYSSDTESSTYSYPDSDFGSGFSTSSSSEEEEEDEDDTQSESSEVSSDDEEEEEEESSSQSDSSSVSSRVSVQSIRFRRPRVCLSSKTPLVMQPTFQYKQPQEQGRQGSTLGHCAFPQTGNSQQEFLCSDRPGEKDLGPQTFRPLSMGESFYLNESKMEALVEPADAMAPSPAQDQKKAFHLSWRTPATKCPPLSTHGNNNKNTKFTKCARASSLTPCTPLKKIKTESEEPLVTSYPDSTRTVRTPPFNLCNVKVKVEENCDEYGHQCQTTGFKCAESISDQHLSENNKQGDVGIKAKGGEPDVASVSLCGLRDCISGQDASCVEHKDEGDTICRAVVQSNKKPRLSRTQPKHNAHRVNHASSSSSSSSPSPSSSTSSRFEKAQTEDLPSRRKRSTPFSLMANFPSLPSLIVGSDGDLCPAHSLNSLRGPGPPPPSHPVWRWQPGGHILPPPQAQRTRKY